MAAIDYPKTHHNSQDKPLNELVAELSHDATLLVQQELALAKTELKEKAAELKVEATEMVIGGAVLYAGVLTLVAALVLILSQAMAPWVAALIVGVLVTGGGAALSFKAKKEIDDVDMKPHKSIQSVKTDVRRMKEAVR